MAEGLLFTFEGCEGTGKSRQIARLAARLKGQGLDVLSTREPGGSPQAEIIRREIVSGDTGRWSPIAETLLINAARDSHIRETIRPALKRGAIVLCDRFMDSTRAYQGAAGGVDAAIIDWLEKIIGGDTRPRLTLIFDLDPEQGLARAKPTENRFEQKGRAFHERLRSAYHEIAKAEPARCRIIDAAQTPDNVSAAVWELVEPLLVRS